MKKSVTVLAVAGAFVWTDAALAQAISRVTLYPGSATIERAAKVQPGTGKVQMSGLPANFDPRTLRVETDGGIHVGEVAVQDVSRAEALSAREADLETKIQALADDKAALEVEVKTAELVRDYLMSLRARPGEGDKAQPIAVDPKAIPAVIEALRRGGGDAYGQIQRIEIKKRTIDKQVAALQRDLARLRTGARDARSLAISYTASHAGEVRATYQVTNAGWKPVYRAALDSSSSRVELERQATIMQRTGEDWRGVALRLSTGQPRRAQIADPSTWQLVIRPPAVQSVMSSEVQLPASPKAMQDQRTDRAERKRPEEAPIVAQFETQYATEFEVPGQVDLPADGRQVNVSLATQSIPVDVRVISATHRDLDEQKENGQFREDLYYRLNVVSLKLPPLADRREDIPLLATHFLRKLAERYKKPVPSLAPDAMALLISAPWPGNVRQLLNLLEQAVALTTTSVIPATLVHGALREDSGVLAPFEEARKQFERDYLVRLLKITGGNVTQAATLAKRNRTEFYKLLQRHRLEPAMFKEGKS
jgi:hypothetical protein